MKTQGHCRIAIALLALSVSSALTLLLPGCGGGSKTESTEAPSPDPADATSQAPPTAPVSAGNDSTDGPPTAPSYDLRTEGSATVPHFTDVLADSGIDFRHHFLDSETGSRYQINPYDHGSGVCVADVNGDGLDDVYFLDFLGPNKLYLNRSTPDDPGIRFEDFTEQAGVAVDRAVSVGAAFGDYDNDGDADLYVTTYRGGDGGNVLFRNRGDGTFEDVTQAAGVAHVGHSSATTWFDYDLDGDLDLYLTNIGKFTTDTISREADYCYEGVVLPIETVATTPDAQSPGEPDILWRNNGDGTFTDVTAEAGLGAAEWNGDATVADVDLDGDLDLYVSNMFGPNHLYHNNGDGTFTEVTDTALPRTSWGAMGCKFFDANGDEYPDLYVVDMHSDMWIVRPEDEPDVKPAAKYDTPWGARPGYDGKIIQSPGDMGQIKKVLFGNTYFENNGDGTFTEKSAEAGLENWWPWGITVGDYNNDGHQDLFVASGMGFPYFYWQNHLLLNEGDGVFFEASEAAGIEPPAAGIHIEGAAIERAGQMIEFTRSSRSAATADFDQDGDLDLVVNNFNHEPYLLQNGSPGGNYLRVVLLPVRANRDAYGARVRVTAGGRTWSRQLSSAEGYLTQSSRALHFGLGDAEHVDKVEIFWPGQSEPQVMPGDELRNARELVVPQL